jgi:hypothetical protein
MQQGESWHAREDDTGRNPARAATAVAVDRTYSRKAVGLSVVAALLALLSRPTLAGVGVGVAPTYPPVVQVGDSNIPVGLSITNSSTGAEAGGTLTLNLIRQTPSCGSDTPIPCPATDSDTDVFVVKGPAIGMTGTACAGTAFSISTPDTTTGEVEFTPSSPIVLGPVGTGALSTCTIDFLVDVLKLPTHDASSSPGIQTNVLGRVRAVASVNGVMGTGTGSGVITVLQPTPTPTTTPTATPTTTPTPTPACVCTPADLSPGSARAAGETAGALPLSDARMGIRTGVDCLSEICLCPPGPRLANGLPGNKLVCRHDDPTCDAVAGDAACTFTFRLCFNRRQDNRFLCNAAGPVTEVRLRRPREGRPTTAIDLENRDAFEAALMKLGGRVGGVSRTRWIVFNPPLEDTVCTDPVPFKLALRQNSRTQALSQRTARLNYRAYQSDGTLDGDTIFFRCTP